MLVARWLRIALCWHAGPEFRRGFGQARPQDVLGALVLTRSVAERTEYGLLGRTVKRAEKARTNLDTALLCVHLALCWLRHHSSSRWRTKRRKTSSFAVVSTCCVTMAISAGPCRLKPRMHTTSACITKIARVRLEGKGQPWLYARLPPCTCWTYQSKGKTSRSDP